MSDKYSCGHQYDVPDAVGDRIFDLPCPACCNPPTFDVIFTNLTHGELSALLALTKEVGHDRLVTKHGETK